MIRVWRDQASGLVYQFGGWRYALLFIALLAARAAMRLVVNRSGIITSATVLNDAFIGMMVGNFLGCGTNVGVRALALLG